MTARWHTGRDCSSVGAFLAGMLLGTSVTTAVLGANYLTWRWLLGRKG